MTGYDRRGGVSVVLVVVVLAVVVLVVVVLVVVVARGAVSTAGIVVRVAGTVGVVVGVAGIVSGASATVWGTGVTSRGAVVTVVGDNASVTVLVRKASVGVVTGKSSGGVTAETVCVVAGSNSVQQAARRLVWGGVGGGEGAGGAGGVSAVRVSSSIVVTSFVLVTSKACAVVVARVTGSVIAISVTSRVDRLGVSAESVSIVARSNLVEKSARVVGGVSAGRSSTGGVAVVVVTGETRTSIAMGTGATSVRGVVVSGRTGTVIAVVVVSTSVTLCAGAVDRLAGSLGFSFSDLGGVAGHFSD